MDAPSSTANARSTTPSRNVPSRSRRHGSHREPRTFSTADESALDDEITERMGYLGDKIEKYAAVNTQTNRTAELLTQIHHTGEQGLVRRRSPQRAHRDLRRPHRSRQVHLRLPPALAERSRDVVAAQRIQRCRCQRHHDRTLQPRHRARSACRIAHQLRHRCPYADHQLVHAEPAERSRPGVLPAAHQAAHVGRSSGHRWRRQAGVGRRGEVRTLLACVPDRAHHDRGQHHRWCRRRLHSGRRLLRTSTPSRRS